MNQERKHEINNFIGIFDNFIPPFMVDQAIEWYKKEEEKEHVTSRLVHENTASNFKKDLTCKLTFEKHGFLQTVPGLTENLMQAVNIYLQEVPLKSYIGYKDLTFHPMRLQKTSPGGGYHIWHVEASDTWEMLKRVLVFSIYLNDIEEGGETEFLYQSVRVKPVKGRIVVWPAYFPFVHRGNPPLKEDKYIITSWLSGTFNLL